MAAASASVRSICTWRYFARSARQAGGPTPAVAEGDSELRNAATEPEIIDLISMLQALGAQMQVFTECLGRTPCRFGSRNHQHSAVVVGPTKLQGTNVHVPDLRAGFSYVLAALAAQGDSTVTGVSLLDRGYENFRAKLVGVGAKLR